MKDSDLIQQTFGPCVVWVQRNGVTVRGIRPDWLDWPSVRGDEIANESWKPQEGKRGKTA